MIRKRAALFRILQGYVEASGLAWSDVVARHDHDEDGRPVDDERRIDATFSYHGRAISVYLIAASEDQNERIDGELLPRGRLAASLDGGPEIRGEINQSAWDAILAAAERPVEPSAPEPNGGLAVPPASAPLLLARSADLADAIVKMAETQPELMRVVEDVADVHPELARRLVEAWRRIFGERNEDHPTSSVSSSPAVGQPLLERKHDERGVLLPQYRTPSIFPKPYREPDYGDGWAF
jgi:hypothetical protein